MRVAMYYRNNDVRIEEVPRPKIVDGELLVRVQASGICGTDVMEWYRVGKAPLVLGHEIAGEIVAAGNGVTGCAIGDRISVSHHVPCMTCHYCLRGHHTVCDTLRTTRFDPGGFAEFVRIPAINVRHGVYRLPKDVSYEEATFIEPLACVVRGQRIVGVRKGDTVLVIGSGISGILHVKLARARGAAKVIATDVVEYRLAAAKRSGADGTFLAKDCHPEAIRTMNQGMLADIVIVCAGSADAHLQALASVERGGTVLFFAASRESVNLPISVNDFFWRNEMSLVSSYAGSPDDHREALELIRDRSVGVRDMITHRLGLNETGTGFRLVAQAQDSIKVIIEPQK